MQVRIFAQPLPGFVTLGINSTSLCLRFLTRTASQGCSGLLNECKALEKCQAVVGTPTPLQVSKGPPTAGWRQRRYGSGLAQAGINKYLEPE